jgi:hypothetical protein
MFREKQTAGPVAARPNCFQFPAEQVSLEQLLANPQRERHPERPQPARRQRKIVFQKPFELKKRLFVENRGIHFVLLQARRFQTVTHGVSRKPGIVLLAGKALLLRGGHNLAVPNEGGGAVVVESGDTENPHGRQFSEEGIDERRQRAALRQDQEHPENQDHGQKRQQPKLLPDAQKFPKFG